MNNTIKNSFGVVLALLLFVFMYVGVTWVSSYAKSNEPTTYRSFSVSSEGKVVAIPDIAQFTFDVITEGGLEISDLQDKNIEKMNNAIKYLKGFDVDEKDIKTQNYNVNPRYTYHSCPEDGGPCPPQEITGYSIQQTVLVKVRDFENIGKLLSGVVNNGANSVSRLTFSIDDLTQVQNEARSEAIEKASQKARLIAKDADFKIGKLINISEWNQPSYRKSYGYDSFALEAADEGGYEEPIVEPGSQEVKVTIILEYEIK